MANKTGLRTGNGFTTIGTRRRQRVRAKDVVEPVEVTETVVTSEIRLKTPPTGELYCTVTGTTPLVTHAWDAKARLQMLSGMMGDPKERERKCPEEEFVGSIYWLAGDKPRIDGKSKTKSYDPEDLQRCLREATIGLPVSGIKRAMVGAGRFVGRTPMTQLKAMFFVHGIRDKDDDFSTIEYSRLRSGVPKMREDLVRIGKNQPDIRYRAEFFPWSTEVRIEFRAACISAEKVANYLHQAGTYQGLCEMRPEKGGPYGQFEITGIR